MEPATLQANRALRQFLFDLDVRIGFQKEVNYTAQIACPLSTAGLPAGAGKSEHALWRIGLRNRRDKIFSQFEVIRSIGHATVGHHNTDQHYTGFEWRAGAKSQILFHP
jgi:hypothetical protein